MAQAFNIDKVLKGQPVVTRDGRSVGMLKELTYDGGLSCYTALIDNKPYVWDQTGKCLTQNDNTLDLFMAPEVRYAWVKSKDIEYTEPENQGKYTKIVLP